MFGKLNKFIGDLTVDTNAAPPVIPKGDYQINVYTVNDKITIQQQLSVGSGNNYYKAEKLYWNPDNYAYLFATIDGWERP